MGEKKLAYVPDELEIYEMALRLNKLPDEIRNMAYDDFHWMLIVPEAKRLADEELKKRKTKKDEDGNKRKS